MWTHPLTIALVAVISSLLTILLTPMLQHHLWKYQRRDELRLAAINELNRLMNDCLAQNLFRQPPLGADWFAELNKANATIEALFSPQASTAVEAMGKLLKPGIGLQDAKEFACVRDVVLRALYREVIPLPRARG